ncbi:hypothetical protein BD324DRAFT_614152 [Kockovaella imperatae]|uniref:Uncharacterized protein n=1 Tax=Kockovaella imperatae TaxID=4999 RepID=A0A1Y1UNH2_9TREE|nr:hypothetical protein BD324DRAFT_614152 [Kockovaella imperatae]ORX39559.1 hypothetical protein BD324DRAFT_614152 [Kockovaella imperatae]
MLPLIRAWTRQPLQVSIELYQSPVILYDQADETSSSDIPGGAVNHIGASISLSSETEVAIGGVTLIRQVLLRRKKPKVKEWTEWVELQRAEFAVMGEYKLNGKHKTDAYIPVPWRLPETRHTTFDQIVHLLTAIVHDLSPLYTPVTADPSRLDLSEDMDDSLASVRRPRKGVLALCHLPIDIVHCPSLRGDTPQLEGEQIVRLSDSGKVSIKAASRLFVLGSNVDISLDFENLTQDTTIHAISVILIQETFTPPQEALPDLSRPTNIDSDETPAPSEAEDVSPATRGRRRRRPMLTRLSNIWAQFKEKPALPQSSVIDEYALISEGVQSTLHGHGSSAMNGFLWRGAAGRILDARRTSESDVYIDDSKTQHVEEPGHAASDFMERTTTTFRFHRRIRLPSEVNGAHHSTSTMSSVLAKVGHRLVVDIIYSVLGQDELGRKASQVEGSMRRLTTKFEIDLPPCGLTPSSLQPPSYRTTRVMQRPSPRLALRRLPSTTPSYHSMEHSPTRHTAITFAPAPTMSRLERHLSATSQTTARSIDDVIWHIEEIAHSRAFRASNGRVIAPKRVFYSESDIKTAAARHKKERGHCACSLS